jgi:hypothetical protein
MISSTESCLNIHEEPRVVNGTLLLKIHDRLSYTHRAIKQ